MIRRLAVFTVVGTLGACTTFSATPTPTSDDAGSPDAAGADAGARFCESARATLGTAMVACEDFEGDEAAAGFTPAESGALKLDVDPNGASDRTRSGRVDIPTGATGSAAVVFKLPESKSSYHIEGHVRFESAANDAAIVLAMKVTSAAVGERDILVVRAGEATLCQVCVPPKDGGPDAVCDGSSVPQSLSDWTHVAVDFDVSSGAVTFKVGNDRIPKTVAGFIGVADGSVSFGAVAVPQLSADSVVHIDDVLVTVK